MAHAKFPVQVVTPEGEVFSEEIEMLSTRTQDHEEAKAAFLEKRRAKFQGR